MSPSLLAIYRQRADDPHAVLADRYCQVRLRSIALAAPLSAEDAMVQSMPDASPTKWHLAHTTWFFEHFVLAAGNPRYRPVEPAWDYLFNSYYQSVGPMHARAHRGVLSRPSLARVIDYRELVDARLEAALARGDLDAALCQRVVLGLHHERQHQELLLTDIKHALWCNPLKPAYREDLAVRVIDSVPASAAADRADTDSISPNSTSPDWLTADEAIVEVGCPAWPQAGAFAYDGFAYDNESPRHRVLVGPHALARRPVSNADYRAFIDAGGYRTPTLWLSEGWARAQQEGWTRPLYWDDSLEQEFTLGGLRAIAAAAPVCHLSYFEADAFARWAGARLPTEFEWERAAAAQAPMAGNFAEDELLHPAVERAGGITRGPMPGAGVPGARAAQAPNPNPVQAPDPTSARVDPAAEPAPVRQMFGDVWEWTSSAYGAYPGFREMPGALGEYNGKFMCGQQVLRGGSCATAGDHVRASYRNFFYPPDRWQFSGLRLARDG